jgi:hypothetical protein
MTDAKQPPVRSTWFEKAGDWLSEEALSLLLLFLVVEVFVLPVFGPGLTSTITNLVFTALVFTGLATVASRGIALAVGGVLVTALVVLKWIAPIPGLPGTPVAAAVATLAAFGLLTLLVLLRTLSPGPITRHRIEGAIAVYLLFAISFGVAFEVLEWLQPGSIKFAEGEPEAMDRAASYFSLVTLTTVGYGDVTPVSPLARRVAMLAGFIGQLYPAIIIGWMVGSMKRRED